MENDIHLRVRLRFGVFVLAPRAGELRKHGLRSDSCRINNDLALHASVAETAGMATLKRISARRLSQELNRGRFSLLELPTLLCRTEN